jgi:hypothetical protein
MNEPGLLQRVRGWFGGKGRSPESPAGSKHYTLGPLDSGGAIAVIGGGASATGVTAPAIPDDAPLPSSEADSVTVSVHNESAEAEADRTVATFDAPSPAEPPASPSRINQLDPTWMRSFDELPARLAESAAKAAAGARSLENIGAELEGHRQATRAIVDSVRRLPELATGQADLVRQTNKTLERQALVQESALDMLVDLRSAFRGVEESSRRQIQAIAQLEYGHRQILFEYQELLQKSQRRLGRMALCGILLAAVALGAVAVAIFKLATMAQ